MNSLFQNNLLKCELIIQNKGKGCILKTWTVNISDEILIFIILVLKPRNQCFVEIIINKCEKKKKIPISAYCCYNS